MPAFYIADTGRGYTDEQESRYGLVFNYRLAKAPEALTKIEALLARTDLSQEMQARREKLLKERICATDFILDYTDRVVKSTE